MARTWAMAVVLATAGVLGATGCRDDGGDDAAPAAAGAGTDDTGESPLVGPFEEAAESAYEAGGQDRSEDFTRGVVVEDGCFVLTGAGAVAVAEALGVEDAARAEVGDGPYLVGPPGQRENLNCSIDVGVEGAHVGVAAGTTLLDRDEVLEELELYADREDDELTVLDGEAPGLDADEVVAVARDGYATFGWVRGDFQIALTVPDEVADHEAGFRALPVVVEVVTETLSGE